MGARLYNRPDCPLQTEYRKDNTRHVHKRNKGKKGKWYMIVHVIAKQKKERKNNRQAIDLTLHRAMLPFQLVE